MNSNVEAAPPQYEQNSKYNIAFSEQSVRSAFIKKVFFLVTIMFTIVTLMCAIPFIWPSVGTWLNGGDDGESSAIWVYILAICVFIGISIALSCFPKVRRSYPLNLILLFVFTIAAGFMTMTVTAYYSVQSVLIALAITSASSASIVVFAIFIKKDLTSMIGIAFVLTICLMFYGIIAAISIAVFNVAWLYTLYSVLGALLFMFWLAIDVQMLMGTKKYSINPEDYIFAAMQLFLDILNIFMFILAIVGVGKK